MESADHSSNPNSHHSVKPSSIRFLINAGALLMFLFACAIIQYFIWSDLFIQEFDADVAENVLWARLL